MNDAPVLFILAAGSASRMKSCKQLCVLNNGKYMINHLLDEAKKVNFSKIWIITGQYHEAIQAVVPVSVPCLYFKDWAKGMGATIAHAAAIWEKENQGACAVFSVSDQPTISTEILNKLVVTTGDLIQCQYSNGAEGPPTKFGPRYRSRLLELTGAKGAKSIVQQNLSNRKLLSFPSGWVDMDTPKDYEAYKLSGYNTAD